VSRTGVLLDRSPSVTAGEGGHQFHRDHRYPGAHPVISSRYAEIGIMRSCPFTTWPEGHSLLEGVDRALRGSLPSSA